jgi:uncharacterized protein (TIGR02588 family)
MSSIHSRGNESAADNAQQSNLAKWVEWTVGALSALIVILMLAWVTSEALNEDATPPDFTISVTEKLMVQGGFRLTFDITNTSPHTAAAVVVRGEILEGTSSIEDAEVTFDYVPGGSRERGALFFSQDPQARSLRVRTVGYVVP